MDEATCTSETLSPEEDKLAYACKPQNSVQNGNDELSNKAANFGANVLTPQATLVAYETLKPSPPAIIPPKMFDQKCKLNPIHMSTSFGKFFSSTNNQTTTETTRKSWNPRLSSTCTSHLYQGRKEYLMADFRDYHFLETGDNALVSLPVHFLVVVLSCNSKFSATEKCTFETIVDKIQNNIETLRFREQRRIQWHAVRRLIHNEASRNLTIPINKVSIVSAYWSHDVLVEQMFELQTHVLQMLSNVFPGCFLYIGLHQPCSKMIYFTTCSPNSHMSGKRLRHGKGVSFTCLTEKRSLVVYPQQNTSPAKSKTKGKTSNMKYHDTWKSGKEVLHSKEHEDVDSNLEVYHFGDSKKANWPLVMVPILGSGGMVPLGVLSLHDFAVVEKGRVDEAHPEANVVPFLEDLGRFVGEAIWRQRCHTRQERVDSRQQSLYRLTSLRVQFLDNLREGNMEMLLAATVAAENHGATSQVQTIANEQLETCAMLNQEPLHVGTTLEFLRLFMQEIEQQLVGANAYVGFLSHGSNVIRYVSSTSASKMCGHKLQRGNGVSFRVVDTSRHIFLHESDEVPESEMPTEKNLFHFDPDGRGKLPYLCIPILDKHEETGQITTLGVLGVDRLEGSVAGPFEAEQPERGLADYLIKAGHLLSSVVFATRMQFIKSFLVEDAQCGHLYHVEKLFDTLGELLLNLILPSSHTIQLWALNQSGTAIKKKDVVLPPLPFLAHERNSTIVMSAPKLLSPHEIQKAYLRTQTYSNINEPTNVGQAKLPCHPTMHVYTAEAMRLPSKDGHIDGLLFLRFEDDDPHEEEKTTMALLTELEPLVGVPHMLNETSPNAGQGQPDHRDDSGVSKVSNISTFAKFTLACYRPPCSRTWLQDNLHLQQIVSQANAILRCLRARERRVTLRKRALWVIRRMSQQYSSDKGKKAMELLTSTNGLRADDELKVESAFLQAVVRACGSVLEGCNVYIGTLKPGKREIHYCAASEESAMKGITVKREALDITLKSIHRESATWALVDQPSKHLYVRQRIDGNDSGTNSTVHVLGKQEATDTRTHLVSTPPPPLLPLPLSSSLSPFSPSYADFKQLGNRLSPLQTHRYTSESPYVQEQSHLAFWVSTGFQMSSMSSKTPRNPNLEWLNF
jgi:hypothetical protein